MLGMIVKVRVLDWTISKGHFNLAFYNFITLYPTSNPGHNHPITK